MDDAELAAALNIPVEAVPKIDPGRRALFERMIAVGTEADLYAQGLGPKPTGALLDFTMPRTRPRLTPCPVPME